MLRLKSLFFFLFLALASNHCKEPYQLDTSGQNGLLVVDGSIGDLKGPYVLTLGFTNNRNLPTLLPTPVLGATVSLTDDQGTSEYYIEVGNGTYQLNGTILQGNPGRSYNLYITLADGKNYYSNTELMPSVSKPIDSAHFNVSTIKVITNAVPIENWYVNVLLNTTFQENNIGYFRWSVAEVYFVATTCPPGAISCPQNCYVYSPYSFYNLNVIDRADYSGNSIQNIQLINRGVDYSFDTRHYFNITQFGMNSSAFNYWKAVQQLTTNVGTIFQSPPYTIRGNMHCVQNPNEIVLGYFEASTQKLTRKYIDRGSIPTFIQSCTYSSPDYLSGFDYCTACLILSGSTYTQPDWFW